MLQVEGILKFYGKKRVLNHTSFTIHKGSLNAIVGENGAGKSTLLKIIIGELRADEGQVVVQGSVGYCPQEPLVFSMLTVEENFKYFATAYGLTRQSNNNWLEQRNTLMDELGFSQYLKQRVDKLSGGTRQKLNLSISLLHDPSILILDEPYGGFDWETYRHFYDMMLQLKDKGKTILLVTHLLNDISMFDKVFTLKEGKIA